VRSEPSAERSRSAPASTHLDLPSLEPTAIGYGATGPRKGATISDAGTLRLPVVAATAERALAWENLGGCVAYAVRRTGPRATQDDVPRDSGRSQGCRAATSTSLPVAGASSLRRGGSACSRPFSFVRMPRFDSHCHVGGSLNEEHHHRRRRSPEVSTSARRRAHYGVVSFTSPEHSMGNPLAYC
jgi:hypothetical protein